MHAVSRVDPTAHGKDVLYASSLYNCDVYVFSYPRGKLVQTINADLGFGPAFGLCSDKSGDVFMSMGAGFSIFRPIRFPAFTSSHFARSTTAAISSPMARTTTTLNSTPNSPRLFSSGFRATALFRWRMRTQRLAFGTTRAAENRTRVLRSTARRCSGLP